MYILTKVFAFFCFGFIVITAYMHAQLSAVNSGMMMYEAGEYTAARNIYSDALNDGPEPWQAVILYYNIGTTLMKQAKYQEAIDAFQKALDNNAQVSPLVLQKIYTNKALARLLIAHKSYELLLKDSNETELSDLIMQFRQVLSDVESAEKAACQLSKAEGDSSCPPLWEIEKMRSETTRVLALVIQKRRQALEAKIQELRTIADLGLSQKMELLLALYDLMLLSDPIHEQEMAALIETQDTLKDQIEALQDKKSQRSFVQAQTEISLAQQMMHKEFPLQTIMFAEAARNSIKQLSFNLKSSPDSAEEILKRALDSERFALLLNHLLQRAQEKENIQKEALELVHRVQSEVIQDTHRFVKTVIEQQETEFRTDNASSMTLWDEIIPLYIEGKHAAQQANTLLDSSHQAFQGAQLQQEKSISKWEEALAKMHEIKSQQQEKETASSMPTKQTKEDNFNEVLRLLQEMEEDDKSKQEMVLPESNKEVLRPW